MSIYSVTKSGIDTNEIGLVCFLVRVSSVTPENMHVCALALCAGLHALFNCALPQFGSNLTQYPFQQQV